MAGGRMDGAGRVVEELVHEVRRELPETTIHVRDGGPVVSLHLEDGAGRVVEELVHEVRRELPETTIHVRDGGPVVSLHLGVGSVSLAWRNFAE
jgi:fatty acid-binding protein DegV